jgi:hypothetical protein
MAGSQPDLYVDIDALDELGRQLSRIKSALSEAKEAVNAHDRGLGSPRLEEALDDFISGWRDGRRRITEGIEGLLGAVQESVQAYLENERNIQDATRGGA